ncbi:MAG TPA: hypothetical protein PLY52_03545 [Methanothrix sp.]|jgi:hypothetical protein|uniref:hypothetical protein n=1 Tax=Methanothrix sp. TaxID=90426 RepID=UPI002CF58089|nr:hypothetical protein [Methanothrix sp.]HON35369.1 hypothetical protein [Methanothrix sp.]HRU74950.1 hypothetical protein [Methanothrix sp.]
MTIKSRIIIKFRPDLITVPYQDAAQQALPAFAAFAWQQLASLFPDAVLSLNRLITIQTADQIIALLNTARERSGEEPPNLLSIMAIDVDGIVDVPALVADLIALPFVEFAYEETMLAQSTVNFSDDPLAILQGYLFPAPIGIDAFAAWNLPGSDGANVKFGDIELGWNLAHEDLAGAGVVALNQSLPGGPIPPKCDNVCHSTACLGIVLAQDNDKGVIGIAPKVKAAIASAHPSTIDAMWLFASQFLGEGDILLMELETFERDAAGNPGPNSGKPLEIDPHIALFIRFLTLLGIVVIEPAGNGGHNLDGHLRPDGTSLNRFLPTFFDSGAIMVGARHAATRARTPFSCFGNRVDCHAWGEQIVTTSSIPSPFGPYMGLNPLGGDLGFGGTSGASAIIAGAAVVLQGIARARGTPLSPSRMRDLLSDTFNTFTDNPDGIGVMPNLEEAANHI